MSPLPSHLWNLGPHLLNLILRCFWDSSERYWWQICGPGQGDGAPMVTSSGVTQHTQESAMSQSYAVFYLLNAPPKLPCLIHLGLVQASAPQPAAASAPHFVPAHLHDM
jgi:hypothetical protein